MHTSDDQVTRLRRLCDTGDIEARDALIRIARHRADPQLEAYALTSTPASDSWRIFKALSDLVDRTPALVTPEFLERIKAWDGYHRCLDVNKRDPDQSYPVYIKWKPTALLKPTHRAHSDSLHESAFPIENCVAERYLRNIRTLEFNMPVCGDHTDDDGDETDDDGHPHRFIVEDPSFDYFQNLWLENIPLASFYALLQLEGLCNVRTLKIRDSVHLLTPSLSALMSKAPMRSSLRCLELGCVTPHPSDFDWLHRPEVNIEELTFNHVHTLTRDVFNCLMPPDGPPSLRAIRLRNVYRVRLSDAHKEQLWLNRIQLDIGEGVTVRGLKKPTAFYPDVSLARRESGLFIERLIKSEDLELDAADQDPLLDALEQVWPRLRCAREPGAALGDWLMSRAEVIDLHAMDATLAWLATQCRLKA